MNKNLKSKSSLVQCKQWMLCLIHCRCKDCHTNSPSLSLYELRTKNMCVAESSQQRADCDSVYSIWKIPSKICQRQIHFIINKTKSNSNNGKGKSKLRTVLYAHTERELKKKKVLFLSPCVKISCLNRTEAHKSVRTQSVGAVAQAKSKTTHKTTWSMKKATIQSLHIYIHIYICIIHYCRVLEKRQQQQRHKHEA